MKDDRHEPAMPSMAKVHKHNHVTGEIILERLTDGGLTKAEYAALVTGQPCSGTPWLDEMLAKARRERLAGQALQHIPLLLEAHEENKSIQCIAQWSCEVADALIAALEGGDK